ncbi:MAG: hypothetical protein HZC10_03155 [Nitrospirae bacterium]|nr:hypothetical protein [Nitrospirota bacterium]
MNLARIDKNSSSYPETLNQYLCNHAPKTIFAIGNPDILQNKTLAFFSSVKCPGSIILKTYDLMKELIEKDTTIIKGVIQLYDSTKLPHLT